MIADIALLLAFGVVLVLTVWGCIDILETAILPALRKRRAKVRFVDRSSFQGLMEQYIKPGIQAEVERVLYTEALQEIREQLGFKEGPSFLGLSTRKVFPPAFSVDERVNAIAEHLGLVFDKTDAQPAKVILRKPAKPKKHRPAAGGDE